MNSICIDSKKVILEIKENTNITEVKNINTYLELNILDNVIVNLNSLINLENNREIIINQSNNSICNINMSCVIKDNTKIKVINNIKGNNNKTNINIRIVTENNGDNKTEVILNVLENTKDNVMNENIKGLILNDKKIEILPIMNIDTKEVIANHACTISSIDKDYLFYLASRNISELEAISMIKKSFLQNIFADDFIGGENNESK